MNHPKIRLLVAYDGSEFGGWQRQKSGAPTVQGCIEQALTRLFNQPVKIQGAGRTDAGVHAFGQVAHFRAPKDPNRYNLVHALNGLTPDGILIRKAWEAPEDFHALASAVGKIYRYRIWNHPQPNPFLRHFSTWVRPPLDIERLQEASNYLLGKQDFKSFQTSGTPVKSTVRRIVRADWRWRKPHQLEFTVLGQGFLKQMMRNIVGTLLDMHQSGLPARQMLEILQARDRRAALGTAAPEGLYLHRVLYPKDLDNRCRKL